MADDAAKRILSRDDYDALLYAVQVLEDPSLATRIANLIGVPIESLLNSLPDRAGATISKATEIALRKTLSVAIMTMRKGWTPASKRSHKLIATASGAIGGATGVTGLIVELPITTTIIFRAIADIARAEDEDLQDPATIMACMQVFALGGPKQTDDAMDSAYFASRVAVSKVVHEATTYLARGATQAEAPLLARLVTKLAARFGVVVSYKTAAQLAPVIGAIGGATINALFVDHYQNLAEGHFTVRRLERKYGRESIATAYRDILRGHRLGTIAPLDEPADDLLIIDPADLPGASPEQDDSPKDDDMPPPREPPPLP